MSNPQIPILDMNPEVDALWDELMPAIQGVLRSTQFIMGPNVKAFEQEVASYLGTKHAIAVNSGTDALVIALRALGIGPGDEVITTTFTFFATAEAISMLGASPIFVDIDPITFNLDVAQVKKAISEHTKAIIPVHLFGLACDMGPLMELASLHGLDLVEDVAQAMGGSYNGKKLGTLGEIGCYSFFPSKNLGAYGDGGLITTDDDSLAETCRMLRVHGAKKKYYNEVVGYNSRLDEIQAAILRVKLPYLDKWNDGRRAAADRYAKLLAGLPGVVTPTESKDAHHVYHQYTVRLQGIDRDRVQAKLGELGVSTMLYYPVPCHHLPLYKALDCRLPLAEQAAKEVLSLPIWPTLDAATQERVAGALAQVLAAEQQPA